MPQTALRIKIVVINQLNSAFGEHADALRFKLVQG
jgi:hypothetical protein